MSAGSIHKRVKVLPGKGLGENIWKKWDLTWLEFEIHTEHGYRENEETRQRGRSKGGRASVKTLLEKETA